MISSEDILSTPPDIMDIAKEVTLELLPQKSREVYECAYNRVIQWCTEMNVKHTWKMFFLVFFANLFATMKS